MGLFPFSCTPVAKILWASGTPARTQERRTFRNTSNCQQKKSGPGELMLTVWTGEKLFLTTTAHTRKSKADFSAIRRPTRFWNLAGESTLPSIGCQCGERAGSAVQIWRESFIWNEKTIVWRSA